MSTSIKQSDLIESVAAALQYISYYHPADYIAIWLGPMSASKAPLPKTRLHKF